jgi:hypothetical protein
MYRDLMKGNRNIYWCRCEWQYKVTVRKRKDQLSTQNSKILVQSSHSLLKEKSVSCHRGNVYGGLKEQPKMQALRPEECTQRTAYRANVVGLVSFLCSTWWLLPMTTDGTRMTPSTFHDSTHSKYGAAQPSDWATDWTVRGSNSDSNNQYFSTPKPHTSSGAHSASYLMATEVLLRNKVAGPPPRMSGDVPPFPLYVLNAWKGTTFTFISAYILWDYGKPRET